MHLHRFSRVTRTSEVVATAFLTHERPAPSIDKRSLSRLVQWALDLGWKDNEVSEALPLCRAFTRNALEYTLRNSLVSQRLESVVHSSSPVRVCPYDLCGGSGWVATEQPHNQFVVRCKCWTKPDD